MRRGVAIGLFALAVIACSPLPDVVAYAPEGGDPVVPTSSPTGEPVPPSPTALPIGCTKIGGPVVIRTKDGRVASVADRASKAQFYPLPPDCIVPSAEPVAVASDGLVWAASGGKVVAIDPSGSCKPLALSLTATAMAFVIDPKLGREQLYAIVDGVLVVVDPGSLLRTPIAKVSQSDITGLADTLDGRLFGVGGRGKAVVYEVGLGDGTPGSGYGVALDAPVDEPIVGLAFTPGGAVFASDSALFWLEPKSSAPAPRVAHGVVGVVAAASSPCSYFSL